MEKHANMVYSVQIGPKRASVMRNSNRPNHARENRDKGRKPKGRKEKGQSKEIRNICWPISSQKMKTSPQWQKKESPSNSDSYKEWKKTVAKRIKPVFN